MAVKIDDFEKDVYKAANTALQRAVSELRRRLDQWDVMVAFSVRIVVRTSVHRWEFAFDEDPLSGDTGGV